MNTVCEQAQLPGVPISSKQVIRGLLTHEWSMHGRWISFAFLLWLFLVWIVPFPFLPIHLLILMSLFGGRMGNLVAAADAMEGVEEFTLTLPPTRDQRFIARVLFVLVPLMGFTAIACAAMAFNLPQLFWGLFVESGFTKSFPLATPWDFLLALTLPFYVTTLTFAAGSFSSSRIAMAWSNVAVLAIGVLPAAAIVIAAKERGWSESTALGSLSFACSLTGVLAFVLAWAHYRAKQTCGQTDTALARTRTILAMLVFLGAVLAAMFVLMAALSVSRVGR